MASRDFADTRPQLPEMDTFLQPQVLQSEAGDAASILSSRMTDIASEDGGEHVRSSASQQLPHASGQRQSTQTTTGDSVSRPNTALTGVSSRGAWGQSQTFRRGFASVNSMHRGAMGSVSSSAGTRPESSSRTHVPSLSSHAFFHPMNAQRLQAQRGSRPTMTPQNEDRSGAGGGSQVRHSVISNNPGILAGGAQDDEGPPPPSRGTEMTEQETVDRLTANTSPTGHRTGGSLTESVRPLQGSPANTKNLTVNIDRGYKSGSNLNLATPSKSPRSFRSSFLLPSRGEADPDSKNRSTQGREKLSSVASSPGLRPNSQKPIIKPEKLGGNYQYFTGNTLFFWGGRLQNARDKPINIATGTFVVLPGVFFFVFSASWLWHNISPGIPVIFAYIFYICVSSFIHASVSDPGILPRNLHPMPPHDENEDPLTLGPTQNDWTMIKSAQSSAAAMEVPTKYCKTCNIWRPPRGHHCRVCDNCIETQDHHCVWLNNCVGRRNYRYFFTFVTSCTLLGIYLIGASLAQIIVYMNQKHISFGQSINHFRVPFAMAIYGLLASPYPAALMGYHLFLVARGETTREYLNSHKFLKEDRHRPFTQGNVIKNWFVVLCRPRPPTYLRFKQQYEDGDQRFGTRKGNRAAPLAPEFQGAAPGPGVMEMQDVITSEQQGFQGPSVLQMEARN